MVLKQYVGCDRRVDILESIYECFLNKIHKTVTQDSHTFLNWILGQKCVKLVWGLSKIGPFTVNESHYKTYKLLKMYVTVTYRCI